MICVLFTVQDFEVRKIRKYVYYCYKIKLNLHTGNIFFNVYEYINDRLKLLGMYVKRKIRGMFAEQATYFFEIQPYLQWAWQ